MKIPKLIHQTWKTTDIPEEWVPYVEKVKALNPDWEYKFWTDQDNEDFIKNEFPDLYSIYMGLSKDIMRAHVIRYLIMYKMGGVYLDLDYEVLEPFDFKEYPIVVPLCRSLFFGDPLNELGICIFASVPGHKFWADIIQDLKNNPPVSKEYLQVLEVTGPMFITKIFNKNSYNDFYTPERVLYHPVLSKKKKEMERIRKNGISKGIHHTRGYWKQRWTLAYLKYKINNLIN